MAFKIEIYSYGVWTDDASLLGHGVEQTANEFSDELEALAAIDDLVAVGFPRDDLQVVQIA
jgi:hypothetical protein